MLAVAVLVATVMLLVVAGIFMTRSGAEDVPLYEDPQWVTLNDDEGIAHQIHVRTKSVAQQAQWMTFYDDEGNEHQALVR